MFDPNIKEGGIAQKGSNLSKFNGYYNNASDETQVKLPLINMHRATECLDLLKEEAS
jgi:hypothetical protein